MDYPKTKRELKQYEDYKAAVLQYLKGAESAETVQEQTQALYNRYKDIGLLDSVWSAAAAYIFDTFKDKLEQETKEED